MASSSSSDQKAPSHFKPGKTINKHERHYVIHNYHDYANEPDDPAKAPIRRRKGGVTTPFPLVLHRTIAQIEQDGLGHIIGWQPHGRCFVIFKPKEFVNIVMPQYFNLGKLSSFQRQLNLYGFNRITRGLDATGYYHEYFLRDREYLAKRILRKRIKGTKIKGATNPDLEPDFYTMPPVGSHPDPNATPYEPPTVSSDDLSQSPSDASTEMGASTNNMELVSSASSSSRMDTTPAVVTTDATIVKPLCNFVFPKYFTKEESDQVDDLLNSIQAPNPLDTPPDIKSGAKDWDLQESILGQYLIFDDEDNFVEL